MTCAAAISRTRATLHTLVALTLAFLALAASSTAWADPPGRVGRIADTDGNVWLFEEEQGEWVQARRNRPVVEGDRISAERGARATIQIGGGTLRLDGGTDVEFTQLDDARVNVRVLGGSVALRVRSSQSVREFALVTEEGRYEPLRPGHYRVDVEDRSSIGETLAGTMRFEARDSVLDLNDGQRAEFWQESGVTHYAWSSPSNDRFGDWVAREDREDTRERNRYVSDEMTGAGDLDRYGQWDRHPDYGAVWYPTAVAAGWAPYRYGQWAYVRPWGWTWVDDAPWGFAPFHYGRWVNYGGRWGWCPGQYVARPVYAPALVAWFGGSNVSVGIGIGGPHVGWVPLAPREIYYPYYHHTPNYVRIVNATHGRWHGPNPRYERPVPTGPIMYTNQGVAGGVTVVPQGVVQARQPIGNRVAVPVDARTVSTWQSQAVRVANAAPPAPPAARIVATPGGAVPAPPNAARNTTWGRAAARVSAAQGDGGQARRGVVAAPGPVQPQTAPSGRIGVPVPSQAQAVPPQRDNAAPQRYQRDGRDARDGRDGRDANNGRDRRDEREDRGERRFVTPAPAQPRAMPGPQAQPQLQRVEPPQVRPVQPQPQVQRVEPPQVRQVQPQPQVRQVQPQPQLQRVEPPQLRPVQPTMVPPPGRPAPRANDADSQQRGRAERERGVESRQGQDHGRNDERMWRGRDPRDQQQVR